MPDIPARPPLDPVKILALSPDDLLGGPPDDLQYKMYALLRGQADLWAEDSPEFLAAEHAIDRLFAALPVHPDFDL